MKLWLAAIWLALVVPASAGTQDTLSEKLELFRRRGRVVKYREGVFLEASWIAVYIGQRVIPLGHDMRVLTW